MINSRRWFNKWAAMIPALAGASVAFAQQAQSGTAASGGQRRTGIHNGIYYFPGIGANSGFPNDDRVLVTDPFEKHVTRTMDSIKKSVERAGCTMDSILHLEVYTCLPLAEGVEMPTGKARVEAHRQQYGALNKIYGTYFSPGKAPSRAYMAVEWIPGDSLVEIVGCAAVVNPPAA